MSNIGSMEGQEPPKFVGYPRPHLDVDPDKLELLRDAYFGCYWLVAGTVGVGIGGQFLGAFIVLLLGGSLDAAGNVVTLSSLALMILVNLAIAYRYSAMMARAKGRSQGYAVGLALVAALLTPCCLGLLGCAVIQQAAASEFKLAGIRSGFFGVKKAEVQARIDAARREQAMPPFQAPDAN